MAEFEVRFFSANSLGAMGLGQTDGSVRLQTQRLTVKSAVAYKLATGETYYVGYVQVCYRNSQVNHYGPTVQQKWEFNQAIVSDSADKDERPWYGSFKEHNTEGFRRRLVRANRTEQKLKFSMTDDFSPSVSKFETLPNNTRGPNLLSQITRDQRFRLWLVAVPCSVAQDDPNGPAKYIRMAEVDWRYQYDISVTVAANHPHNVTAATINTDLLTIKTVYSAHGRGTLTNPGSSGGNAIPAAAMTAPIANDNQQLTRYVNTIQTNIIVPRQA